VPLVSSGVEGLSEIVTREETALVTTINSPDQITDGVERLVHNPELTKNLADNAFQLTKIFSVSRCVKSIEKIYVDLLQQEK